MKKNYIFRTICLLLVLLIVSCVTASENNKTKQQAEASRNLGEAYMGEGNYTAALRELLSAEKLDPDDPYLQNDLGLAYMAKEKLDIAIEHFKKAIELKSDYAPARNNLGTAYLAKKDWDAAIVTFKEVSKDILYATPHYPLSNLGLAYYQKKDYKTSEAYYKESLALSPDFVIALWGLGRTYLSMGKIPKSLKMLEKAVEKASRVPDLYLDLAKAYTLARKTGKAVETYRKIIAFAPDTSFAEEAQRYLDIIEKTTN